MKKLLQVLFLFLMACSSLVAQVRMSGKEVSFRYNQNHDFIVNEVGALEGNKVKAYFQFILNSGNVRITDYSFSYFLRDNYLDESLIDNRVSLDSGNVVDVGFRQYVFEIEFDRTEYDKLLVFDIFDKVRDKHYYVDLALEMNGWTLPPFVLMNEKTDIPHFGKYLPLNASVRPVHLFDEAAKFEITGYKDESSFPMPPFEDVGTEQPVPTAIDTLYGVNNKEKFTFYNEGYFKISSPQAGDRMLPILITDEYYPYYDKYEELVKPLIFITTNEEFQKIRTSDFPRDAFEEFVSMTVSTNQSISKGFIRSYYERIRRSARLFTADRKGWKTDRGMIYQIFGRPQQVFRNETTELWGYSTPNGGRVRYIFDIIPENGGLSHKLIRGKRYREDWMQAVGQWRSGRIIE